MVTVKIPLLVFCSTTLWDLAKAQSRWQYANPERYPDIPISGPKAGPDYMVDNQNNYYETAPDQGRQRGPVWKYSGSLENYIDNLNNNKVLRGGYRNSDEVNETEFHSPDARLMADDYWLTELGPLGDAPLAGNGYQFFRDVTEFGADPEGRSDATEAINAAISSWSLSEANGDRELCGQECGNTFVMGAIIYFPPGTYRVCTPVIQLYYTQFVGHATRPPIIKGCEDFVGIALFDTDPYIPGGSGAQWFINQNQFFRQMRNFVFDLTEMPLSTEDHDQPLVPTGIHWQVAQATSLQNIVFNMPEDENTTAVGIFTENGSGGFVSDLTFNGGAIGWRVGSQQFTVRNLRFNNCLTAVQMIWDWGFNWQKVEISGGAIGFNISGVGGDTGQGVGSISIIDSEISDVPVGILTNGFSTAPNIVLDGTVFDNVERIVQVDGGSTLLSSNSDLWAHGRRYNGSEGSYQTGDVTAPPRPASLVDDDGKYFTKSRPQHESRGTGDFLVATSDGGCDNDGGGDQANCINSFLQNAVSQGKIAYFPAGIYAIARTVFVPTGSRLQGSSWSQIQGSGFYFDDMHNPQVMIQVGNKGDIGVLEITEMLFSVKGRTAGAIMMEWNVAASEPGAAGMWDSHLRVGGGIGTDLDIETCPKFGFNDNCISTSMGLHVTKQASGYFENVWVWLADHDNDASVFDQPDSSITQISIYGARGMLVESQGPSWFYGGGSEHFVLYNYLLSGAKDVFLGHIQSEAPYYQPAPPAPEPFGSALIFPNDPDFSSCEVSANVWDERCRYAWAVRIIDSSGVVIHSAGLYSFFNEYYQDCVDTRDCQSEVIFVSGSYDVVVYNLFTVAVVNIASGIDGTSISRAPNQRGFSTEVSVWLPLEGVDNVNIVYVGPEVFEDQTLSCDAPCMLIFPTSRLDTSTVITPSVYTTSLEFGTMSTTSSGGAPVTIFVTSTTTLTLTLDPITLEGMPFSNFNVTSSGEQPITIFPSVDVEPITIELPAGGGSSTDRVVPLPPWPLIDLGPDGRDVVTDPNSEPSTSTGLDSSTTYWTGIRTTVTATGPTVMTLTFPATTAPTTISCPATTEMAFDTPRITVRTTCTNSGTLALEFRCPTTKVLSFLGSTTAAVQNDCSLVTSWSTGQFTSTEDPLPVWTTWPRYGTIEPVTTSVPEPSPSGDGVVVPCNLWFFFICLRSDDAVIAGWYWILPPGIYPPGPPPTNIIRWPPGFRVTGTLPPWPEITIGNDRQLTTSSGEPECETRTGSACSTTTTFFGTASGQVTRTTLTSVSSYCATITGCAVSDSEEETSTTVIEVGTHTAAPIGTWVNHQAKESPSGRGEAYTNSVFASLSRALASQDAENAGTTISFTPGPTASPTCASSTACGGRICSGFWCPGIPTGFPPGFKDPEDPRSDDYTAPTRTVGGPSTTTSSRSTTTTSTRPDPSPSQEVRIYFRRQETRDIDGGSIGGNWVWLERAVGGGTVTICEEPLAYWQDEPNRPLNNPGWPPSMQADDDIWGRSGCRYFADGEAPGDFQCDGVSRFGCLRHIQFDEEIDCIRSPLIHDTWFPRVICVIPASASRLGGSEGPELEDMSRDFNGTHVDGVRVVPPPERLRPRQ